MFYWWRRCVCRCLSSAQAFWSSFIRGCSIFISTVSYYSASGLVQHCFSFFFLSSTHFGVSQLRGKHSRASKWLFLLKGGHYYLKCPTRCFYLRIITFWVNFKPALKTTLTITRSGEAPYHLSHRIAVSQESRWAYDGYTHVSAAV